MPTVKLSTGETVEISERWTHGMEKTFNLALFKNGREVTAAGAYGAYEAVLPTVVEKIAKGSEETSYSVGWLEGLPEKDYRAIVRAVDDLSDRRTAEGEKNR